MRPLVALGLVAVMAATAGAQPPADSSASDPSASDPSASDSSGAAAVRRPAASRSPDRWLGGDKPRHLVIAGMVQGGAFGLATAAGVGGGPALLSASAATAVVSLAKEWHDRRRGGVFSARDLAWDAAGAALWGVLVARSGR